MSTGPVCRVLTHDHVVYARHHHYSAFHGYRYTISRYSGVLCMQSGRHWRTKSAYVNDLPDITPEQEDAWRHGRVPLERTQ